MREHRTEFMGWLVVAVSVVFLIMAASLALGQEQRLREIEIEKRYQEERFNRASLEMKDAQRTYKDLTIEEQKLQSEKAKAPAKAEKAQ